jgi:hypothetical protein
MIVLYYKIDQLIWFLNPKLALNVDYRTYKRFYTKFTQWFLDMLLCVKILWNLGASKPHSKLLSKYLDACEQHQHKYYE